MHHHTRNRTGGMHAEITLCFVRVPLLGEVALQDGGPHNPLTIGRERKHSADSDLQHRMHRESQYTAAYSYTGLDRVWFRVKTKLS